MKIFKSTFFIFFSITCLAFFLRIHNYSHFPIGGETADESAWAFLGASIIQEGQPTSWSYFAPYENNFIYLERPDEAPFVRPALDHPPLFSLLPGLAHSIKGSWETFPSLKVIRLPMVLLGTLNVLLLLLLANTYFKKKQWVYLTGLIYATAPSFVMASRLVVAENLLVTWTLLALFLLRIKKWKYKYVLLLLIGVLAVLTKVSGIVIPLAVLAYGLLHKNKKISMSGLWGLIGGIVLFCAWGFYFNWQLFIEVFASQAGRELGLATLHNRFFLHPSIVEKLFFDGWITLGLIASFISIFKHKKSLLSLHIFIILNVFFIVATSGEQTFHAWYDYMLYPLFVVAMVDVLKSIVKKSHFLLFSLLWLLIAPLIRVGAFHGGWYQSLSGLWLRGIMAIGLIPLLLEMFAHNFNLSKKYSTYSFWIILVLLIGFNVYTVVVFNQVSYWETDSFFYYR